MSKLKAGVGGVCLSMMLAASGVANAATVTWFLQDVTFDDNATATGSFVYDTTSNLYTNWSINVTLGTLSAFSYTPGNSTAATCCADELKLTTNDLARVLSIDFTNAGDPADSPQLVSGRENDLTPFRFLSSGSITQTAPTGPPAATVPEPASLALLAPGVLALCLKRRFGGGS